MLKSWCWRSRRRRTMQSVRRQLKWIVFIFFVVLFISDNWFDVAASSDIRRRKYSGEYFWIFFFNVILGLLSKNVFEVWYWVIGSYIIMFLSMRSKVGQTIMRADRSLKTELEKIRCWFPKPGHRSRWSPLKVDRNCNIAKLNKVPENSWKLKCVENYTLNITVKRILSSKFFIFFFLIFAHVCYFSHFFRE